MKHVSHMEVLVQQQGGPSGTCGEQRGTGAGFLQTL
jgi:hypothetical protein